MPMMSLSDADRVWNRAATQGGGKSPMDGDKALSSLLLFHGLAMNGGVHHALEVMEPAELEAARAGFNYFGLSDVAAYLEKTDRAPLAEWTDSSEVEANAAYSRMVPNDDHLARHFESDFSQRRDAYSPLSANDAC